MNFSVFNRRLHYWTTAVVALPVLVVVGSGLLLQIKKHWRWVQPSERLGTGKNPGIDFEDILATVQGMTNLTVRGWGDVARLDVRPGRGLVKVQLQNGWEVQLDLGTGRVLQTAYRRSDIIESVHDGTFFGGEYVRLGIFLPAGVALFLMWLTGLWMFWIPFSARRRRKAARAA
jgi:hypothetical protein